jgi:hypothetical protein
MTSLPPDRGFTNNNAGGGESSAKNEKDVRFLKNDQDPRAATGVAVAPFEQSGGLLYLIGRGLSSHGTR